MKKHNNNFWKAFSRGILVMVLIAATVCGLCGLGAALNQIPWFFIAGAICFMLIVGAAIWFLGYYSRPRQVQQPAEQPVREDPVEQPAEQVIILRKTLTPEEFNKAYNLFNYDEDENDAEESAEEA